MRNSGTSCRWWVLPHFGINFRQLHLFHPGLHLFFWRIIIGRTYFVEYLCAKFKVQNVNFAIGNGKANFPAAQYGFDVAQFLKNQKHFQQICNY